MRVLGLIRRIRAGELLAAEPRPLSALFLQCDEPGKIQNFQKAFFGELFQKFDEGLFGGHIVLET